MATEYLPEFGGTYLEDSYYLGLVAEGRDLRLHMLFAVTTDHEAYAPPIPGEQHCYRKGSLLLRRPAVSEWKGGRPALQHNPDGTFDLDSLEIYRIGEQSFRVVTEWFEFSFSGEVVVELTGRWNDDEQA